MDPLHLYLYSSYLLFLFGTRTMTLFDSALKNDFYIFCKYFIVYFNDNDNLRKNNVTLVTLYARFLQAFYSVSQNLCLLLLKF